MPKKKAGFNKLTEKDPLKINRLSKGREDD